MQEILPIIAELNIAGATIIDSEGLITNERRLEFYKKKFAKSNEAYQKVLFWFF